MYIPEPRSDKKSPHVPEFVRNVMGSSAGAGSGEFHVYRHLRRKEYARQKHIQLKADKVIHFIKNNLLFYIIYYICYKGTFGGSVPSKNIRK